ncbi:MAG: type VI secretion system protein TssA, partial [Alphaproteobacteria bacterium]|nr:type VI secretion system protein TssA [Alphaproteobacteria bacterium]
NGLVGQYWDTLHSITDDSDPSARGEPLAVLNGKGREGALIAPIRKIVLTPAIPPGPFAYWQCEQQQRRKQLEEIEAIARQGGRAFYQPLLEDIAETQAAFAELAAATQQRMGADAPPTSAIRDVLVQVADMVQLISGIRLDEPGVPAAAPAVAGGAPAPAAGGGGEIGSREQALATILRVARYFREHEPHSPISYTLEDAVRRARLALPELLEELLQDEETRRRMLMNAGIQPAAPKPA